jgi:hypothetical protein
MRSEIKLVVVSGDIEEVSIPVAVVAFALGGSLRNINREIALYRLLVLLRLAHQPLVLRLQL